ncbi:MAG: hypothetical protein PHP82_00725 [Candidatus ainarchaeum sp.]|nr:hypothetical protein [Candidatus ainarchaeum sp.]
MKVCLVGVGDKKFHFNEMLNINDIELDNYLNEISFAFKNTDSVPVCLTDYGILFDFVKKFKSVGGNKVIGLAPLSDDSFGISHLQEFINAEINSKKVFDEIIDTGDWYKQDMTHCLFGDVILVLGLSTGSLGELAYGYYLYNLIGGFKKEINDKSSSIHKKICAGKNVPLHTIVFSPFLKEKLPFELEKYVEKFGAKIFYVSNSKELENVFVEIKKDWPNK